MLADSGSAPNVANHKKHFPGSQLVKDTGSSVQFQTATGQPFESKGKLTVDAESMEGYRRRIVFDDADVSIPILSIGLMTDNDNDVLFKKKGGKLYIYQQVRRLRSYECTACISWSLNSTWISSSRQSITKLLGLAWGHDLQCLSCKSSISP